MVLTEIRVLHLDDKPDFAELTATFLEREDSLLNVESVTTASEGLDRLQDGDFHCIVSDYDMPTQDGIEFLKGVRREHPSIPFILFTGKGSEEVASDAITAGVTDYLQKETGTSHYELLANRIVNSVKQHRAEKLADEAELRLQTLTENTNDILWMFSVDWSEILFVNSAYEDIWGGSLTELRANPQSFIQDVHPGDRDQVKQSMEQLSAGNSTDDKYRVNADEDFGRWVWVQGEPIFDDEGDVSQIVGFARDVTELWEYERTLERYESMVEASGDPIYTLDERGHFTNVNSAFVELTGYDEASILGAHASKVMKQENILHAEKITTHLLSSTEDRGRFDLTLTTATGEHIPCENHIAILPFEDDFRGTVGVLRDITEQVSRVQNLRHERDLLDEFAGVVSHDLRSPLTVASGRLALARDECDNEHFDAIERAHSRIEVLIQDLLTLAKNGDKIGEVEPINLADIVTHCWHTVAAEGATINIETTRTVNADFSRLQQLLENLFRNAIQHSDDAVTITVEDVAGGFRVRDDGPGITEDDRDKLFDAGYTTSAEGSGLGLSIVREIASAHGWDIEVSSSTDGGAQFDFIGR